MNLDKNLRYYREQAGYKTAKEFADILNIPYNTYTAYENQKREPKLEMLIKIADLLNISLDDLVGRTPTNEDEKLLNLLDDILLLDNRLDFFEELNSLSESLQKLIQRNIQETVVINGSLIGFGLLNWLSPSNLSILHNLTTLRIVLRSLSIKSR